MQLTRLMLLPAFSACLTPSGNAGPRLDGSGVLFIGNSLTYTNELPSKLVAIARAGGRELSVQSLVGPNRALIDFVLDGSAARAIQGGTWSHIVMQQGPTTVPVCRDTLVLAVRIIDSLGQRVGASPVVMMSWPTIARPQDFPKVRESAHMAANVVRGRFAPVGDAWRLALLADPQLPLYGPDGYHPAPHGSWLAALVLYEQIVGDDARTLTDEALRASGLSATSDVLGKLRSAAHAAGDSARSAVVPPWTPSVPPSPGITC